MRDFAQVRGTGTIDKKSADIALRALEIDELGLDAIDRRLLMTMIRNYNGGSLYLQFLVLRLYRIICPYKVSLNIINQKFAVRFYHRYYLV